MASDHFHFRCLVGRADLLRAFSEDQITKAAELAGFSRIISDDLKSDYRKIIFQKSSSFLDNDRKSTAESSDLITNSASQEVDNRRDTSHVPDLLSQGSGRRPPSAQFERELDTEPTIKGPSSPGVRDEADKERQASDNWLTMSSDVENSEIISNSNIKQLPNSELLYLPHGRTERDKSTHSQADSTWRSQPSFSPIGSFASLLPSLRRIATLIRRSRSPDIEKIVKFVELGNVIQRVPTKDRRRWGMTLFILFDQSIRLLPFRQDYKIICDALERLIPWGGVRKCIWSDDSKYVLPPKRTCVVAFSDLGSLVKTGSWQMRDWEKYGQDLRKNGCRPIAILPGAPIRDLKSEAPSWQVVSWQRAGRVVDLRKREQLLDALLTLASQADRVEPGLLRSLRRLLGTEADGGLEASFWQAAELLSNHPIAATIDPTERAARRGLFAVLDDELRAKVIAIIRNWRQELAHVYVHEVMSMDEGTRRLIHPIDREFIEQYFISYAESVKARHASANQMAWLWHLMDALDPKAWGRFFQNQKAYDAAIALRQATHGGAPGEHLTRRIFDVGVGGASAGVGFVADIKNRKSNNIVRMGLEILANLGHRGAVGADPHAGEGCGILTQIPHDFFTAEAERLGFGLPAAGQYGVGFFFLPRDPEGRRMVEEIIAKAVAAEGQILLGWRDVPVDSALLGESVKAGEPVSRQVFVGRGPATGEGDGFERRLFILRKAISGAVHEIEDPRIEGFYPVSMSSRTIVYKGLLLATRLGHYYRDLADERFTSAVSLVHQRFSTNTFPSWSLSHPYRMVAHNGEINTLRGNVNWMAARQASISSELYGADISKLWPISYEGQSDTACFDNALEFLVQGGYSLSHAMMMLIPEAWAGNPLMDENRRAFYEYNASLMEPWDGPAAIAFTDGRQIGATLDRNGLRPARYLVTDDDLVVLASEMGVLPIPEGSIVTKWRLQPGKMLLVDLEKGCIVSDDDLKAALVASHPYRAWVERVQIVLETLQPVEARAARTDVSLLDKQQAFGYTQEDLSTLLTPMGSRGEEATGSMGMDTPISVLSDKPKLLYTYFKQKFAQVTNSPIDPIREELVMSLVSFIGPRPNIFDFEGNSRRKRLEVRQPILTNDGLEKIRCISYFEEAFDTKTLDITYPVTRGAAGMEAVLKDLCDRAEKAVVRGYNIIILSDQMMGPDRIPIPALLATAAVHHHLIRKGLRTSVGLVVETGEAREVHHFACLAGYGAEAINPYLAFETLASLAGQFPDEIDGQQAVKSYIKSIGKGLLKVMSKMGISTYQSYCGAQIFDAVGLATPFVEHYFKGTATMIEGVGLAEIAEETATRHALAFGDAPVYRNALDVGGDYAYRVRGETHSWTPQTVSLLQHAVRGNSLEQYRAYAKLLNEQDEKLLTIRGLFRIKTAEEDGRAPVPIEDVESAAAIVRRFATGAMSFGSISREAHTTLAIAMNRIGGRSNTGEGGEEADRFTPMPNGDSMRSAIKQVASGRFGATTEYLVNSDMMQIKMAQGAKPGEGGQLPGHKVDAIIAKVRHSTPGVGLISPPPHHDIYSIEDLAQLIFDLKNVNPQGLVSVKLVAEVGVGTVAAGVSKGRADHVTIAGFEGGTGAAPLTSIKHAGSPWEIGLAETHQTLVLNRLRSRITVQVDGGLRTGRDVVIGALLGADEFGFATAPLIAAGCIMMRKCHLNTCPVGVATQDPVLRKRFVGLPEHVINFFFFVAEEVREWMARLGYRRIDEMIGQMQMLDRDAALGHWKTKGIDFTRLFHKPAAPAGVGIFKCEPQDHGLDKILDLTLIERSRAALDEGTPVSFESPIQNTDRTTGAMLSGLIARKYGHKGLPDGTIHVKLRGTAGQSFGAWAAQGLTLELEGEANDYVGKGLSGGRLVVYPSREAVKIVPEASIIVGNTVLYGAISGECYFRGVAGERFAVRNSGAIAVVEGTGDHGCEYMTGGIVVVLGPTGRNFAAGMSGGIAYVYDETGEFDRLCNTAMVQIERVAGPGRSRAGAGADVMGDMTRFDAERLHQLVSNHARWTNSTKAAALLDDWAKALPRFRKVMPVEYRRALAQLIQQDGAEAME